MSTWIVSELNVLSLKFGLSLSLAIKNGLLDTSVSETFLLEGILRSILPIKSHDTRLYSYRSIYLYGKLLTNFLFIGVFVISHCLI